MAQGVQVLAAAAGSVRNVRDAVDDTGVSDERSRTRIAGRECGNGVLIEHPGGWQTQYCHMRRGSVQVAPGQAVEAGTPLGLVGLSGKTEFPHLHIVVRHAGRTLDPFTGHASKDGCRGSGQSLWRDELRYETVSLYNSGFAAAVPDIEAIRRGERSEGPIPADAAALVLWVDMFGVQAGDSVQFRISRPDGTTLLDSVQSISRTQARRFIYVGDRREGALWPSGTWTGALIHRRKLDDRIVSTPVVLKQHVR